MTGSSTTDIGRLGKNRNQHLARGLLVMLAGLDRRELRRLIIVDVIAVEMSKEDLDGHEHGREVKTHAEHDASLGVKFRRSRYHAPVAATQKAPVMKEA